MPLPLRLSALAACAWLLSASATPTHAQTPAQAHIQTGPNPCVAGTDFEAQGFRVVHTTVDDPFTFLPTVRANTRTLQTALSTLLDGKPYTSHAAQSEALGLVDRSRLAPDHPGSLRVRIEFVSAIHCDASAHTLDLRYRVYSTDPPLLPTSMLEAQGSAPGRMQSDPATAAGVLPTSPVKLLPAAGYSRTFGLFGGGTLSYTPAAKLTRSLSSFTLTGQGSHNSRFLSASLDGSRHFTGPLAAPVSVLDWHLRYHNTAAPGGPTQLAQASLSAAADAQSRTFWAGSTFLRAGAELSGGTLQGTAPAFLLDGNTVLSSGYGAFKLYTGLSARTARNALSASYGLELGARTPIARIDWIKQLADIADDLTLTLGDHRPLEIESRFTLGALQIPGTVPLPERFFGGNVEHLFLANDPWQIRDAPYLRAIPANQFFRTAGGAGATAYTAVNLTLAYPLYRRPLLPRDLTRDAAAMQKLNESVSFFLTSAISAESNVFAWKDPNFARAAAQLPAIEAKLNQLSDQTAASPAALKFPDLLSACYTAILVATGDIDDVQAAHDSSQYGSLQALLPVDSNDLGNALDACTTFNTVAQATAPAPAITASLTTLQAGQTTLNATFDAINQAAALRKATAEIAYPRRILHTLFYDLNLVSIAPVAVLDAARIGPVHAGYSVAYSGAGGTRVGPGGGLRVEIAGSVNFTLGYAANLLRQPGEDRGAVFFTLGLPDLFH